MLSIVIPVFNEAESLAELQQELRQVAATQGYEIETIFVDDGSSDSSWLIIQRLAQDARVRGIRLRRNFGKSAALRAGMQQAVGEIVFTLDGDLQDNPCELPRFLGKLAEGFDVVSGWKKIRHDPWHKKIPSAVFNRLVSWMTKVRLHDHNCGFKCYRAGVLEEVRLYGELHRFIPVLAAAKGYRIGEIAVDHRPRRCGRSKFGLARIPKGFLDLLTVKFLTGFGQRPQHLLGMIGLLGFGVGSAGILWLTFAWFATRLVESWPDVHLHERALFFYSLAAMLLGSQFMAVGFLAELITAGNQTEHPPYSIAEEIGGPSPAAREELPAAAGGAPRDS